jgi:hypothetical protein
MSAPRTHINSAIPTLPDERRITLGVAKILFGPGEQVSTKKEKKPNPVPITRLNIRNAALARPKLKCNQEATSIIR